MSTVHRRSSRFGLRLTRTVCRNVLLAAFAAIGSVAHAGAIFITGHDPDFHAQSEAGAQNLLRIGLNYARNGDGTTATNIGARPVLWIESDPVEDGGIPAGHRFGLTGLRSIGYLAVGEMGVPTEGYYEFHDADELTAAFWTTVTTANYSAIGVASTFGGILRLSELTNLNNHTAAITAFFNSGGGIFAAAEGTEGSLAYVATDGFFNWIPISVPASSTPAPPYSVTAAGSALGLVDGDVDSASHSYFNSDGGLDVISRDAAGRIMTLAGVRIIGGGGGGFMGVPEPGALALLVGALPLLLLRRRRNAAAPTTH